MKRILNLPIQANELILLHYWKNTSNLIVSRSLSKAYGLAGLRIGYAVSNPEIADLLNRVPSAI